MSKFLRVTMPDGSQWDVPAEVIIRSYTTFPDPDAQYDDDDLIDWATNNMNWSDVSLHAIRVRGPRPIDQQDGWVNGEKEIISR